MVHTTINDAHSTTTPASLADVGLVVGVVDGAHGDAVGGGGEAADDVLAHTLGGAGGVDEVGVSVFEFAELSEELVVGGVRHDWVGDDVVGAVGAADGVAEFGGFGCDLFGRAHARIVPRR